MTTYFQHVGERGGNRDFPRTIGDPTKGLCRFNFSEIEAYLPYKLQEGRDLEMLLDQSVPSGFQIWGIPSGAKSMLKNLVPGDWLLLLKSDRPGGQFAYAGQVVHRLRQEAFDLSLHLWGEARFPIVLFLNGRLTNYSWETFRENLGYAPNWRLAGNTFRVTPERLARSSYRSEQDLVTALIGDVSDERGDDTFSHVLDQVELMQTSLEGRQRLREHLVRERDATLIGKFKDSLHSFACTICGFDFESVYGEMGKKFIEAHHVEPIGMREGDSPTLLSELVAVCSNCHRMLHREIPLLLPNEITARMARSFEMK
jgi:5-methylcytosine-specific restriction protein A